MSPPTEPRVGALVLAAGRSTRMGSANKLLAEFGGAPLVTRAIDAALASRADPVIAVTGHQAERIAAAIGARRVRVVRADDAARGLSASLRAGIDAAGPECDAVVVCLADMPWVGPGDLDALIATFAAEPQRPICAPRYDGLRGHPVLWPARHFEALRALDGDVGGRLLLERHAEQVRLVPTSNPGVLRDVDTPEDLPEA